MSRAPDVIDTDDTATWPEPTRLPTRATPIAAIPVDLVPPELRPYALDEAERTGLPLEAIYLPLLIPTGVLIGNRHRAFPRAHDEGWTEVPVLRGLIISNPSTKKSLARTIATRFLNAIEQEAQDAYAAAAPSREARQRTSTFKQKQLDDSITGALKSKDDQALQRAQDELEAVLKEQRMRGAVPRLKTNDATMEGLAAILDDNPHGILLERDEIDGLFSKMGTSGYENYRPFLLETYNSDATYQVDRIGRGSTLLRNANVAMLGTTQPGPLAPHVQAALKTDGNDGFLARFQLTLQVDATRVTEGVDRQADAASREAVRKIMESLHATRDEGPNECDRGGYFGYHLSVNAQLRADEWNRELTSTMKRLEEAGTAKAYIAHLGKSYAAMIRLALVLKRIRDAGTGNIGTQIELEHIERAIATIEYLLAHARRLYQVDQHPAADDACFLLQKINERTLWHGMTVRDAQTALWRFRDSAPRLRQALELLQALGHVRLEERRHTGSRVSTVILINPLLDGIILMDGIEALLPLEDG